MAFNRKIKLEYTFYISIGPFYMLHIFIGNYKYCYDIQICEDVMKIQYIVLKGVKIY